MLSECKSVPLRKKTKRQKPMITDADKLVVVAVVEHGYHIYCPTPPDRFIVPLLKRKVAWQELPAYYRSMVDLVGAPADTLFSCVQLFHCDLEGCDDCRKGFCLLRAPRPKTIKGVLVTRRSPETVYVSVFASSDDWYEADSWASLFSPYRYYELAGESFIEHDREEQEVLTD